MEKKRKTYVDLGLSVLWADENLGIGKGSESGSRYYFDTESVKMENSFRSMIVVDETIKAKSIDEIAEGWGEGWRIPTRMELTELCNCCEWKWRYDGHSEGYEVIGNGNSIFLPVEYKEKMFGDYPASGSRGGYWSSSIGNFNKAWCLIMDGSLNTHIISDKDIFNGFYVRPVIDLSADFVRDVNDHETTYIDRMINERDELCERITKLENALDSSGFRAKVSKDAILDMKEQLSHMVNYHGILVRRLGKVNQDGIDGLNESHEILVERMNGINLGIE